MKIQIDVVSQVAPLALTVEINGIKYHLSQIGSRLHGYRQEVSPANMLYNYDIFRSNPMLTAYKMITHIMEDYSKPAFVVGPIEWAGYLNERRRVYVDGVEKYVIDRYLTSPNKLYHSFSISSYVPLYSHANLLSLINMLKKDSGMDVTIEKENKSKGATINVNGNLEYQRVRLADTKEPVVEHGPIEVGMFITRCNVTIDGKWAYRLEKQNSGSIWKAFPVSFDGKMLNYWTYGGYYLEKVVQRIRDDVNRNHNVLDVCLEMFKTASYSGKWRNFGVDIIRQPEAIHDLKEGDEVMACGKVFVVRQNVIAEEKCIYFTTKETIGLTQKTSVMKYPYVHLRETPSSVASMTPEKWIQCIKIGNFKIA